MDGTRVGVGEGVYVLVGDSVGVYVAVGKGITALRSGMLQARMERAINRPAKNNFFILSTIHGRRGDVKERYVSNHDLKG